MLTRRMAICVAALLAMAALPAMAADMVDSGAYQSWSKFKVGAMSKVVQDTTMGTTTERTSTLKELTAEKAVVEIKTVTKAGMQKTESTQKVEFPAKVAKPPEPATKPQTKEGTEEIEVAGKKLKCKWVETITVVKDGGVKITTRIWTSDEIPGALAKVDSKTEGSVNTMMTVRVVEFSKGK